MYLQEITDHEIERIMEPSDQKISQYYEETYVVVDGVCRYVTVNEALVSFSLERDGNSIRIICYKKDLPEAYDMLKELSHKVRLLVTGLVVSNDTEDYTVDCTVTEFIIEATKLDILEGPGDKSGINELCDEMERLADIEQPEDLDEQNGTDRWLTALCQA